MAPDRHIEEYLRTQNSIAAALIHGYFLIRGHDEPFSLEVLPKMLLLKTARPCHYDESPQGPVRSTVLGFIKQRKPYDRENDEQSDAEYWMERVRALFYCRGK